MPPLSLSSSSSAATLTRDDTSGPISNPNDQDDHATNLAAISETALVFTQELQVKNTFIHVDGDPLKQLKRTNSAPCLHRVEGDVQSDCGENQEKRASFVNSSCATTRDDTSVPVDSQGDQDDYGFQKTMSDDESPSQWTRDDTSVPVDSQSDQDDYGYQKTMSDDESPWPLTSEALKLKKQARKTFFEMEAVRDGYAFSETPMAHEAWLQLGHMQGCADVNAFSPLPMGLCAAADGYAFSPLAAEPTPQDWLELPAVMPARVHTPVSPHAHGFAPSFMPSRPLPPPSLRKGVALPLSQQRPLPQPSPRKGLVLPLSQQSQSQGTASPGSLPLSPQSPIRGIAACATTEKTTVMWRNIPNNYSRDQLLLLLDFEGFSGSYDFFYSPFDFTSNALVGYAFINFVSEQEANRFYDRFQNFSDWIVMSSKISEITWSNALQGLGNHIDRYRNSPVMHPDVPDDRKPLLFDNGELVPFPPPTKKLRHPNLKDCRYRA